MQAKQMDLNLVKNSILTTPAFVIDENAIAANLAELMVLKEQSGCHVLYSIKALPLASVITLAKDCCDGLSVSSLFEARLANEILAGSGSIHITTPGLRGEEYDEISQICSHISFNSISQYQRLSKKNAANASLGARVNPKLSFSEDDRFDPCRPYSKLGMSFDEIPASIDGIHFHTVFSKTNYHSLELTMDLIESMLAQRLAKVKWLNLGGGYLYHKINNHQPFIDLVNKLRDKYSIDVFIEPGKAVVGNAAYLLTTVIDSFSSGGKKITVLDTSVNHNPEVFEYQKQPELYEADAEGKYSSLLVGSSCLAGDVFGEYQFNEMPAVGERLTFSNVGAYSLIKANRFNGYNLPDVYLLDQHKKLILQKHSHYQDYRKQWG